jgi:hypothetical protein
MTDEQRRQHCDKHEEMEREISRMAMLRERLERLLNGNGRPGLEVRMTQLEDRQMNADAKHEELVRTLERNTQARKETHRGLIESVVQAVLPALLTLAGLMVYRVIAGG